jgi:Xaa-Pro aminopeptidase
MKRIYVLLFFFTVFRVSEAFGQAESGIPYSKYGIYDTDGINPGEYRQRRSKVLAKMDSNSIAIMRASDYVRRSGNEDYRFRQNSNFLYFSGCQESNSTLILIPDGYTLPDGRTVKEILFITPKAKDWYGENLGIEGAKEILGFGSEGTQSAALTNDQLKETLTPLLSNRRTVYYTPSLVETLIDPVSDIRYISWRESMKNLQEKYPNLEVKNLQAIIGEMRTVKSSSEIGLLQKAVDATIAGQIEAMKSCEPGMFEYDLQAIVEYCFARKGAEYTGFRSIIGSGPNAQFFHYEANRRKMKSGELVVMDIGAEYHGYSADITRTIPIGGKFNPAQKDIYELVLQAQQIAIDTIFPGMIMEEIEKKAMKIIADGLLHLNIAKNEEDVKKYSPHGMSHFIGLDVHDGKVGKLVPGMVLTMEPGIYIPEGSDCDQKYWNIGIRIEDDIVVTEDGRSVLSAFSPHTVAEIEALMKKKGIGNQEIGKE